MSQHIFAIHDFGGEHHILESGRTGWVVDTIDVQNQSKDYANIDPRIDVIARLNWGYGSTGTIPKPAQYAAYAERCRQFAVVASRGGRCNRFIVGNEPNLTGERPNGEVITPEMYAQCFNLTQSAIKTTTPNAEVILAAIAPYNIDTGDWIDYFRRVLELTRPDGIALHTYSHGHQNFYGGMMNPPYQDRNYNFLAYQDFLEVVPATMRGLPVYITETNPNVDGVWPDGNTGWVQKAYQEIDRWNREPGNQIIHCLALYRWPKFDRWGICENQGAIDDWRQAMGNDYRIPEKPIPPIVIDPNPDNQINMNTGKLVWNTVLPKLIWPVDEPRITQYFGEHPEWYAKFGLKGHNGLDFGCPVGTPVKAIADGVVAYADTDPGYGNYMRVWHPALSICSFVGHLDKFCAKVGQEVKQGETIALSGNTGNSTGPHVHFEIRMMESEKVEVRTGSGYGKRGQVDPLTVYLCNRKWAT